MSMATPLELFVQHEYINEPILVMQVILLITMQISIQYVQLTWQSIVTESIYCTYHTTITISSTLVSVYLPLISTIGTLIFQANQQGIVPYVPAYTSQLIITLYQSFTLLLGAQIQGIMTHRYRVLTPFIPSGTPIILIPFLVTIESLAWIIRLISLGLRQSINITTGHVLVNTCTGLYLLGIHESLIVGIHSYSLVLYLSLLLLSLFLALELLIAYLQAYIFSFILLGQLQ